jgi:hypothetical protein
VIDQVHVAVAVKDDHDDVNLNVDVCGSSLYVTT